MSCSRTRGKIFRFSRVENILLRLCLLSTHGFSINIDGISRLVPRWCCQGRALHDLMKWTKKHFCKNVTGFVCSSRKEKPEHHFQKKNHFRILNVTYRTRFRCRISKEYLLFSQIWSHPSLMTIIYKFPSGLFSKFHLFWRLTPGDVLCICGQRFWFKTKYSFCWEGGGQKNLRIVNGDRSAAGVGVRYPGRVLVLVYPART